MICLLMSTKKIARRCSIAIFDCQILEQHTAWDPSATMNPSSLMANPDILVTIYIYTMKSPWMMEIAIFDGTLSVKSRYFIVKPWFWMFKSPFSHGFSGLNRLFKPRFPQDLSKPLQILRATIRHPIKRRRCLATTRASCCVSRTWNARGKLSVTLLDSWQILVWYNTQTYIYIYMYNCIYICKYIILYI